MVSHTHLQGTPLRTTFGRLCSGEFLPLLSKQVCKRSHQSRIELGVLTVYLVVVVQLGLVSSTSFTHAFCRCDEVTFLPALAFMWTAFLAQVVLTLRFVTLDTGRLRVDHG